METLLASRSQMFQPMVQSLSDSELSVYLAACEDIAKAVAALYGEMTSVVVDRFIHGLDFHNTEFLRRQVPFLKSGHYQASDLKTVYEEVYLNDELMQEYLDGLLLTYVAWPNQYRILRFYLDDYLPRGESGNCLEIGPGHGYFSLLQLNASPTSNILAFDVSPHSSEYSRRLVKANLGPEEGERFVVRCEDILSADRSAIPLIQRATLAEVLEHVTDPLTLLKVTTDCVQPGALFFITTVINLEAIDHVYLFTSPEEIHELLAEAGLQVEDERVLPLPLNTPDNMLCANYAAICRRA